MSRFTRRNSGQPGIARSRENAYHVRDALVSPAVTQNSCPMTAIRTTILAAHGSRDVVKISPTKPPASLTAATSLAANRKARITSHPISAEKKTERHTPWAAAIAALWVSSAVWAEASYPVCVYMVRRKPTGRTRSQKPRLVVEPSKAPLLLIFSVNTKSAL